MWVINLLYKEYYKELIVEKYIKKNIKIKTYGSKLINC